MKHAPLTYPYILEAVMGYLIIFLTLRIILLHYYRQATKNEIRSFDLSLYS